LAAAKHDLRPVNKENSLPLGRKIMMKKMEETKREGSKTGPYTGKPQA